MKVSLDGLATGTPNFVLQWNLYAGNGDKLKASVWTCDTENVALDNCQTLEDTGWTESFTFYDGLAASAFFERGPHYLEGFGELPVDTAFVKLSLDSGYAPSYVKLWDLNRGGSSPLLVPLHTAATPTCPKMVYDDSPSLWSRDKSDLTVFPPIVDCDQIAYARSLSISPNLKPPVSVSTKNIQWLPDVRAMKYLDSTTSPSDIRRHDTSASLDVPFAAPVAIMTSLYTRPGGFKLWWYLGDDIVEDYNHIQAWSVVDRVDPTKVIYSYSDQFSVGPDRPAALFHSFFFDPLNTKIEFSIQTKSWRSATLLAYMPLWDTKSPDYCTPNPCVAPGAKCFTEARGPKCDCSGTGWLPAATDLGECTISTCTIHKCLNGGLCVANPPENPTCNCMGTGYEGEFCESQVDDCKPDPCPNGFCFDELLGYRCICKRGWRGTNCDQKILELEICQPDKCNGNGLCVTDNTKTWCICDKGWKGPECAQKTIVLEECLVNVCNGHGLCVTDASDTWCVCDEGWKGPFCEQKTIPLEECLVDTCSGNGLCVTDSVTTWCRCNEGWKGPTCAQKTIVLEECLVDTCNGNGLCVTDTFNTWCRCNEGWKGFFCDEPVVVMELCRKDMCSGNGLCFNFTRSEKFRSSENFKCLCKDGWTGKNCKEEILVFHATNPGCSSKTEECSEEDHCVGLNGEPVCLSIQPPTSVISRSSCARDIQKFMLLVFTLIFFNLIN